MKRIAIAALLVTSVLIPAIATGLAGSARADVVAVSLPTAVCISSPTVDVNGTVKVDAGTTGLRSASLFFTYPDAKAPSLIGTATSRRPGFLVISAHLDATRITPGLNQIRVQDDGDGGFRTITVDLRRKSKVSITHAEFRSAGQVALAVKVSHYNPKTGKFGPSKLSPVRLQEKINDVWTTVGQTTTDAAGLAGAYVPGTPGTHDYRAIRPSGATVLPATSKTIRTSRTAVAQILP